MLFSKRLAIIALAVSLCGWMGIASRPAAAQAPPVAEKGDADHEAGESDAAHGAEGAHGSPNPLGFDPDLAIWTAVVFVVLFLVLKKFAWKPIAHALEERERAIENNIAKAEGAAAEARAMLADYEQRLAGASDEVRAMLEEARRDAEHTKQEIVTEARVAAREEHGRVMRDINTAKDQALKELAERSTNIAVDLAGKIVQAQLNKADHAALVQDAMNRLVVAKPSAN
ncbi:MAG: F0F1 ATP synthase subunit B [Pirellulales bacterium]